MRTLLTVLGASLLSISCVSTANDKLNQLLGELKPELVSPGIVTTNQFEYGSSLSPDGKTFAFVRALAGFQKSTLVFSSQTSDGQWSEPKLFPFTGQWHDTNPYFSKDGKHFYFTSYRPVNGRPSRVSNMWRVNITEDGFSQPELISGKVNGKHTVIYPTVHSNKDIYFCSVIAGGKGDLDLYLSKFENGTYAEPLAISELNTAHRDADPELSTDGKLLFYTSTKPGGLGHFDLQVSVKQSDGTWGEPINLGKQINSPAMDSDPILSADGNTLFFSSDKVTQMEAVNNYEALTKRQKSINNGLMNIYRVDISELSKYLKSQAG